LQHNKAKHDHKNLQDLSVIIPACNEEETIGKVLGELFSSGRCYEVIVVDDGSTDQTFVVASAFPVKVIRHRTNKGYGAALKTGLRKAPGVKNLILDSDGQHDSADISAVYDALEDFDMVIGERDLHTPQDRSRTVGSS